MKQLKDRYDIKNIQDNDIDGYGITPRRLSKTELDYSKITDIEVEGIDMRDAPDFVDAFITSAYYLGRPLTDEELDELNSDSDFVYQAVLERIY